MKFWNFVKNAATETEPESVELRIEGDIVDDSDAWMYEWFGEKAASPNAFREELKNHSGLPITVWIDSYGGSVFAAAGIYNALMEHRGAVTVKIDGKAMSAATVIAMAGGKIMMSPSAIMMVHNPLTGAYGYSSDLRKIADVLDEVKESIMNAYQLKTGVSRKKLSDLMDGETYMNATKAVKEGFADGILFVDDGKPVEMSFNRSVIANNTTDAIKRIAAKYSPPPPDNSIALARLALQCEL